MPSKGRQATKPQRDLTGQPFGKWMVLGNPQRIARGPVNCDWLWDCRCECGTERPVQAGNLIGGLSKSCGCFIAAAGVTRAEHAASMSGHAPHRDRTNERYGRLLVTGRAVEPDTFLCTCDCGQAVSAKAHALSSGDKISCGCAKSGPTCESGMRTHGRTGDATYRCWQSVVRRCTNPAATGYETYGGRGIRVCDQWRTFEGFLADMGDRPTPDYSVERIDTNGHYEPGNCKWATRREQANNTTRNRYIEFRGERMTVTEWAGRLGIPEKTLTNRLNRGWTVDRAFAEPWHPNPHHANRAFNTEGRIWWHAKNRCHNPRHGCYRKYGEAGVTMCCRWRESREAFLEDMGPRPGRGYSLDRIDVNKGYWCGKAECPECGPAGRDLNCRWATSREQMNNRRVSIVLEFAGEKLPLTVWAERLGAHVNTLRVRLEKGWSAERTLGTPIRNYSRKTR